MLLALGDEGDALRVKRRKKLYIIWNIINRNSKCWGCFKSILKTRLRKSVNELTTLVVNCN